MSHSVRVFPALFLGAVLQTQLITSQAATVISEALYDAVGADNGYLFVELYGAPGSSLAGLSLQGVNGANGQVYQTLNLTGIFSPNGVFVLGDDIGNGTTPVPNANLIMNFDFQNGPDSIVLKSGSTVLDALGYDLFGAGDFFAGEGAAAPGAVAGKSLARRYANVDTNSNGADFMVLNTPTPGDVMLVPLPGAFGLLLSGLLVPGYFAWRRTPAC